MPDAAVASDPANVEILGVSGLNVSYGAVSALRGVSI